MKQTGWIVAVVLAILLVWQHCAAPGVSTETEIIYLRDTNIYVLPANEPKPETSYVQVPKYLPGKDSILPIDTAAVVAGYYTVKVYNDTLANDSNITAWMRDTLWQNNITYRKFAYRLNRPTAIITNTTKVEERMRMYAGVALQAGFTREFYPAAGPQLIITTRNGNAYNASLLLQPGGYNVGVGAAWLLSFKKGKR